MLGIMMDSINKTFNNTLISFLDDGRNNNQKVFQERDWSIKKNLILFFIIVINHF